MTAGMDPVVMKQLSALGSDIRPGLFRRALTNEAAANIEPLTTNLKPETSNASKASEALMEHVETRKVTRGKMERLESQMERVQVAGTTRLDMNTLCSSVVMAIPKRKDSG